MKDVQFCITPLAKKKFLALREALNQAIDHHMLAELFANHFYELSVVARMKEAT